MRLSQILFTTHHMHVLLVSIREGGREELSRFGIGRDYKFHMVAVQLVNKRDESTRFVHLL